VSEESKTPRTDAEVGYCYDYTSQTELVSAHVSRQLKRELAEAKEREEKLKTMLLDPTTVHINMMRGTIAKLDWPTLEHIHGNHPLRAQLAEAKEAEASEARWAAQYKQERDNALSDYKQADTDSIRSLHERNEARAQRDALLEALEHIVSLMDDDDEHGPSSDPWTGTMGYQNALSAIALTKGPTP